MVITRSSSGPTESLQMRKTTPVNATTEGTRPVVRNSAGRDDCCALAPGQIERKANTTSPPSGSGPHQGTEPPVLENQRNKNSGKTRDDSAPERVREGNRHGRIQSEPASSRRRRRRPQGGQGPVGHRQRIARGTAKPFNGQCVSAHARTTEAKPYTSIVRTTLNSFNPSVGKRAPGGCRKQRTRPSPPRARSP